MVEKYVRFWEIDALRGTAVVMMIVFNYMFALNYFSVYRLTGNPFLWQIFPRLTAGIFIFLAGVSLSISHARRKTCKHYILRGSKIFFLGLVVTASTYVFVPSGTVYFGILHFIGLSVIISIPLIRYDKLLLVLGAAIIVLGNYLNTMVTDIPHLFWLGITTRDFHTLDYFPLFPWLGVIILGIYTGKVLYGNGTRNFKIREVDANLLGFLGRHSLLIYMIHIPLLMALLHFLGLI